MEVVEFASLATLVDEDADLNSMVTYFNKAVADAAAELLGKQGRKKEPLDASRSLIFVTKDKIWKREVILK